jgi:hypothetical protein
MLSRLRSPTTHSRPPTRKKFNHGGIAGSSRLTYDRVRPSEFRRSQRCPFSDKRQYNRDNGNQPAHLSSLSAARCWLGDPDLSPSNLGGKCERLMIDFFLSPSRKRSQSWKSLSPPGHTAWRASRPQARARAVADRSGSNLRRNAVRICVSICVHTAYSILG